MSYWSRVVFKVHTSDHEWLFVIKNEEASVYLAVIMNTSGHAIVRLFVFFVSARCTPPRVGTGTNNKALSWEQMENVWSVFSTGTLIEFPTPRNLQYLHYDTLYNQDLTERKKILEAEISKRCIISFPKERRESLCNLSELPTSVSTTRPSFLFTFPLCTF